MDAGLRRHDALESRGSTFRCGWFKLITLSVCLILLVGGCTGFSPPAYLPPTSGATVTVSILLHTKYGPATLYFARPHGDNFGAPVFSVQQALNLPQPSSIQSSLHVPADQLVQFVYLEPLRNTNRNCTFVVSFWTSSHYGYYLNAGDSGPRDTTSGIAKFGQWLFPLVGKDCTAEVRATAPDGSSIIVPAQITDENQLFYLSPH